MDEPEIDDPGPFDGLPDPPGAEARTLLRALLGRRSVSPRRLLPPGPGEAELRLMARAAARAPDHGGLRPWRFRLVEGAARTALGELCAAALASDRPEATAALLDREREKIATGPSLVLVLADLAEGHREVPESEQQASIGAAIHGFLLAAEALGYRGIMLSGARVRRPVLRAGLGLAPHQHLVGFLTLGRPGKVPPPPAAPLSDRFDIAATPADLRHLPARAGER